MSLLERTAAEEGGVMHYAIMREPEDRKKKIEFTLRLQSLRKIRPIWVKDYDGIRTLLAHIVGRLPASSKLGRLIELERDQNVAELRDVGETLVRQGALVPLSRLLVGLALLKASIPCFQNGNYPLAYHYAMLAHEHLPANPLSSTILSSLHLVEGKPVDALEFATAAARDAGDALEWFDPVDRTDLRDDDAARQLIMLSWPMEKLEVGSQIHVICSFLYYLEGRWDDSLNHSNQVFTINSEDDEFGTIIGALRVGALLSGGRFDLALPEAKNYLARYPSNQFSGLAQSFVAGFESGGFWQKMFTGALVIIGGQSVRAVLQNMVRSMIFKRMISSSVNWAAVRKAKAGSLINHPDRAAQLRLHTPDRRP